MGLGSVGGGRAPGRLASPAIVADVGEGEPVVLVPGMDGTGGLFYRQAARLRASHRVVTCVLSGDAPSMAALVEDLAAVVDRVAPIDGRALVIGESFGGAVVLSLALAHPEKVAALVAINSFACLRPRLLLHLVRLGLRAMPRAGWGRARRLAGRVLLSGTVEREDRERFLALTATVSRDAYLSRLRILAGYDLRDRLTEIRVPSLFLAADRDRLLPAVRHARFLAARVPGAELRVLPGHGHVCLIAPDLDLGQILGEWRPAATMPPSAARR